jgi:hypothetical protein
MLARPYPDPRPHRSPMTTDRMATEANLYAPPESAIADLVDDADAPQFYVVAPTKFLLLYAATLGAYALYWFWRHWSLQKRRYKLDIWPIPRAIFLIFFAHSLNREIDFRLKRVDPRYRWSASANATVFVIFYIVNNLMDRLAAREIGSPITEILALLTLLPTAYALLQAQKAANAACGDPNGDRNRRLTAANYFWLVLGFVLWALTGIVLFMMITGMIE